MKYRQTFRQILEDMSLAPKGKGREGAKKLYKASYEEDEKPTEDKDAIIKKLELEIANLKAQAELLIAPQPNSDTGEVPLRTGVAAALLDKNGPKPKIDKEDNKKKLKMSLGKSKIKVDPDVPIGQISGGIQTGTGNLH